MAGERLDRARVLHEAALLADEESYEDLQMSRLAERLSVSTPALYKHYANRQDLREALATLAVGELGEVLGAATAGRSGPEALMALCRAYRRFATARPGLYAATVTAPAAGDTEHLAATRKVLDLVLAVLGGMGLDDQDAIHAARMTRSCLHGFVTLEAAGGFGLTTDVEDSFERMLVGLVAATAELSGSSDSSAEP